MAKGKPNPRNPKLYDEGKPKKEIEAAQQSIRTKYLAGFESRMAALTKIAKPYAEANHINVKWDVRTSPGG